MSFFVNSITLKPVSKDITLSASQIGTIIKNKWELNEFQQKLITEILSKYKNYRFVQSDTFFIFTAFSPEVLSEIEIFSDFYARTAREKTLNLKTSISYLNDGFVKIKKYSNSNTLSLKYYQHTGIYYSENKTKVFPQNFRYKINLLTLHKIYVNYANLNNPIPLGIRFFSVPSFFDEPLINTLKSYAKNLKYFLETLMPNQADERKYLLSAPFTVQEVLDASSSGELLKKHWKKDMKILSSVNKKPLILGYLITRLINMKQNLVNPNELQKIYNLPEDFLCKMVINRITLFRNIPILTDFIFIYFCYKIFADESSENFTISLKDKTIMAKRGFIEGWENAGTYFYNEQANQMILETIEDYINMCRYTKTKVNMNIKSLKSLFSAHDKILFKYQESCVPNFTITEDNIFKNLTLPDSYRQISNKDELVTESLVAKNCVLSYWENIRNGKCGIFSYNKNNVHCTIEIITRKRNKRIHYFVKQCYMPCNQNPPDEILKEILADVKKCDQ